METREVLHKILKITAAGKLIKAQINATLKNNKRQQLNL